MNWTGMLHGLVRSAIVVTLLLYDNVFGWNTTLTAIWSEKTFDSASLPNTGDAQNFIYIKADPSESNSLVQCQISSSKQLSSPNCNNGDINVYTGDTSGPLIGSFCGGDTDLFSATENTMVIVIRVAGLPADTSLSVTYSTKRRPPEKELIATSTPESITFPGNPGNYVRGYDVFWNITVNSSLPDGADLTDMHVVVQLTDFNLTCTTDAVTFYFFNLNYRRNCGTADRSFFGPGQKLYIRFNTHTNKGTGFTFTYKSYHYRGCDALVREVYVEPDTNGTITPPRWNSHYFDNLRCEWLFISNSSSHRIQLVIDDVDIPSEENCRSDRLVIYNDDTHTPNRAFPRICGKGKTTTIKSDGRYLYASFYADQLTTGKGFRITYSSFQPDPETVPEKEESNLGLIIGLSVGAVIVVAIIIGVVYVMMKRKSTSYGTVRR